MNYDPSWRNEHLQGSKWEKLGGTGKVENDDRSDWREAYAFFPGDIAYVWHASMFGGVVADGLVACGLQLRSQIIWVKEHFTFGRSDYHWQHETCWYAVKKSRNGAWAGDRKQTTVWHIGEGKGCVRRSEEKTGHGTQKPIECMKRPIENNSSIGQAVYEPFSGSFTTGMACELTGRKCYAIELSPNYCDVGVQRWQTFSGKQAIHEETGKTFEEMKDVRFNPAKNSAESYSVGIAAIREEKQKKRKQA